MISLIVDNILENKLHSILEFDKSIRFVGLLLNDGTLESFVKRPGLVSFLDNNESQKSYLHTVLRAASYKALDEKLGKSVWTITLRRNVKWITVYITDFSMIIVSLEVASDHDKTIQKILEIFDVII